jgi:transposase
MTLGKWVKKAREDSEESGRPVDEDERAELERLRKEVARLRMEAEFANYPEVRVMPRSA